MSSKNVLTKGKKQRALGLFQEQRFKEAAELYEQICRTDPRDAQAWCALSTLCGLLEDHSRSAQCAERAITLLPQYADAHNNLSAASLMLGDNERAETSARLALKVDGKRADSWVNLGNALRALKRDGEAKQAYQTALEINPNDAEARVGMGEVCTAAGDFEEAFSHYHTVLAVNPRLPAAYFALGNTLSSLHHEDEAMKAYQQALALKPDYKLAWKRLGLLQLARGSMTDAISSFERAQTAEDDLSNDVNIAYALLAQGRHDEALRRLNNCLALNPRQPFAQQLLIFTLCTLPKVDPEHVFAEHVKWGEHCVTRDQARRLQTLCKAHDRLRIGYVSADLRQHSVAYFMQPILEEHDRARFAIYCYSNNSVTDATSERLQALDLHWRKIDRLGDAAVASLIADDEIDILIDLGGHTAESRLTIFGLKPAPVQVSYLGYPNTTGLREIDYRITDNISDPPGQDRFYTERLVRLAGGFLCYRPPNDAPKVAAAPHLQNAFITFGSYNASHKLNPCVIHLWAEILKRVPNSRLLLKNKGLRDEPMRDRLIGQFEAENVGRERIMCIGWTDSTEEHLALYNRVDIALDTFPYNGTTTTCEALWMGVPVIVLAGDRHMARVGMSLLSQIGLPELIAADEDAFVELAVSLASDSERLTQLRARLREQVARSPLCDAIGFTRKLEEAYLQMWREACAKYKAQAETDSGC